MARAIAASGGDAGAAGLTHNTQDQRLATADATTPAGGIASPLHSLVMNLGDTVKGLGFGRGVDGAVSAGIVLLAVALAVAASAATSLARWLVR